MRSRFSIVLTVLMTGFVDSIETPAFESTDSYAKLAPYRAIRWQQTGDEWAAEVEIDGRWTRLLKIDSRPVADIVAFVEYARMRLGLPTGGELRVELASSRGQTVRRKFVVGSRYPVYGEWPRTRSGCADENAVTCVVCGRKGIAKLLRNFV